MKFANIIIETEKTRTEAEKRKLEEIQLSLNQEIEKIHQEISGEKDEIIATLNKSINMSNLYAQLTNGVYSQKPSKKHITDINTLKFWASELPYAPQAIEYIIRSMFALGYDFELRSGKKANPELLQRIIKFFLRANQNDQSFIDILKTFQRDRLIVGDGFLELVPTIDGSYLAEVYSMRPENVIVLRDKKEWDEGKLVITGYAKVDINDIEKFSFEEIPEENKLPKEEVVHGKYIDEGDAYGHTVLEKGQEISKFILNVINMNQKKFTNEIRHSLWIRLEKTATQADVNAFLAQYRANYLGKNNFGKPLITFGGIEVTRWDIDERNFDYESFMEKTGKHHACSLYGVSFSELDNTDAKYTNSSQGYISTQVNTIIPLQSDIENIVNINIMPLLEGLEKGEDSTYEFRLRKINIDQILMYKHLQNITYARDSGIMNTDEARAVLDPARLKAIDKPWAKKYFVRTRDNVVDLENVATSGDPGVTVSGQ